MQNMPQKIRGSAGISIEVHWSRHRMVRHGFFEIDRIGTEQEANSSKVAQLGRHVREICRGGKVSKLYVRIMTGFYSHRKTARLRSKIGNDAFWIPPRLWAYCAENQPDGDVSGYSADELAMLLGCSSNAQAMLEALKEAGFITQDGKVHGWDEHNRYHTAYAERAKTAAKARWSKVSPQTPLQEDSGQRTQDKGVSIAKQCSSNASSIGGGFPLDRQHAMQSASILPYPPDFVEHCWEKANGRGGADAQDVPIRNWASHLATQWKYEQERIAKAKAASAPKPRRSPNI